MSDTDTKDRTDATGQNQLCEVVGLFASPDELLHAVEGLESTAFPRKDISMIAHESVIHDLSELRERVSEILGDGSSQMNPPIWPEEHAEARGVLIGSGLYIGAIATALAAGAVTVPGMLAAAAVGGAGGATAGAVLAHVMGDNYDRKIAEAVDKGGLLLWIKVSNDEQAKQATEVMNESGAKFVQSVCIS